MHSSELINSPGMAHARELMQGDMAVSIDGLEHPERARALLFNGAGTHIIGIVRARPGRAPYTVLPGGGIEPEDGSPYSALIREIHEEIGVDTSNVALHAEHVLPVTGSDGRVEQWIYAGVAIGPQEGFVMGGPEQERPFHTSGLYSPQWVPIGDVAALEAYNVVPEFLPGLLAEISAIGE